MSSPYFPFHALGLRCNPFRALTDDEWAQIAVMPESVAATMRQGFTHLQILGNPGFGKTTILLTLAAHFKREGKRAKYEYLPEGKNHFETDCRALDISLLDEAQRLERRERERLVTIANDVQLILASHADFARLFESRHLALTTVQLADTPQNQLAAILARRLDYFRLGDSCAIEFSPDAIAWLSEEFRGDLRATEFFLYEVFQQLERAEPITADVLRKFKT